MLKASSLIAISLLMVLTVPSLDLIGVSSSANPADFEGLALVPAPTGEDIDSSGPLFGPFPPPCPPWVRGCLAQ